MLLTTPPPPTHRYKPFVAFLRLWFAWCMALLLAWAAPAQATITTGPITFSGSNPGIINGIAFDDATYPWIALSKGTDYNNSNECPSCPAYMASPFSGTQTTPSTGTIKVATGGDTFNLKGFKVYDWGGVNLAGVGGLHNTKLTVTPHWGGTAGTPIELTLTGANTLQTFTFAFYNVTRVDIASDQSYYFAITDLLVEAGTPPPTPSVSSLSASSGPEAGGTDITITGSNFTGVTGVKFGANAASSYNYVSPTQITATAPPGTGVVDVTVTTANGTSATSANSKFTYVPAPTLSGLSPSAGPTGGGTSVTITGTNLASATAVAFGGTNATITNSTATQITAIAPAGSVGAVNVTVTTPGGTSATSGATLYAYYPPLSAVTSLTNVSCHGGSNGTASVSPTGGVPPYTYSWAPSGGSAATATGLTAGTYTVTVTDASSAALTRTLTITQPATALGATGTSANPTTNGGTNGSATVTPSGGTLPYTYSWAPSGGSAATATGLAAGTYTVTITDANACQSTKSFTLYAPPGAPTIGAATAGNAQASVAFTAPASNGGAPITSYTVTADPAHGSGSCSAPPATSCTVTGLTNGTSYTFTVTATNSAGTSAASAASNSITPASVPSAPTAVTATAGNGSASVSFTAPSSNGGSPITGYSVTSSPAGGSTSCQAPPATSCAVTGLTNGTAYTFTVTATNSAGTSAASAASNSVTPKMAQSITFAQPANQRLDATLTLSATASSGLPVSFSVDATTQAVCQINGTTLSFSSSGSCTVHADQAGNGVYLPATQVSHTLTVHTAAPGAPTNVVAMAGNTQAQVTFAAPHDVGTSPITGYEVTIQPGGAKVSGSASPIVVPGLSNGVTYTFTVATKNATDTGAASSPSNAVTPQGVIHGIVPTPTIGTGTTGTATASTAALDPTLDPNCRLAGAQFASEVPPGYSVSYGSFEFLATDCQHGVSISLTYPQPLPPGVRFMKFGPPSLGAADEWMDWTSKVQLSNGGRTVTYSVLDNGAGDSDTRLGLIADPIIPAALSVPPTTAATIPTLNEWGVILLSAFLGVLGWSQTRRRYS